MMEIYGVKIGYAGTCYGKCGTNKKRRAVFTDDGMKPYDVIQPGSFAD